LFLIDIYITITDEAPVPLSAAALRQLVAELSSVTHRLAGEAPSIADLHMSVEALSAAALRLSAATVLLHGAPSAASVAPRRLVVTPPAVAMPSSAARPSIVAMPPVVAGPSTVSVPSSAVRPSIVVMPPVVTGPSVAAGPSLLATPPVVARPSGVARRRLRPSSNPVCTNCGVKNVDGALCKYCRDLPACRRCHRRLPSTHFSPSDATLCQCCCNKDKYKALHALGRVVTEVELPLVDADVSLDEYIARHADRIREIVADYHRQLR